MESSTGIILHRGDGKVEFDTFLAAVAVDLPEADSRDIAHPASERLLTRDLAEKRMSQPCSIALIVILLCFEHLSKSSRFVYWPQHENSNYRSQNLVPEY